MEVYYEDNPQPTRLVPKSAGVWAFGDSDEEDDFDDIYGESSNYDLSDTEAFIDDKEPIPVLPMRGRIYWVKDLNVVAKLARIRNLSNKDAVFEMSHHGKTFYVNPTDLFKASERQVENYLEESDYNNTP